MSSRDDLPTPVPGERTDWFPTSIWRFNVADCSALNARLLQFILAERSRDPGGMSRSSVLGWHSTDKLHLCPEMQEFVAVLERNVGEVTRAYKLDVRQASVELATCWAMVNGKLASGVVHCHPNAFLSGVYYVSAAEGSGNIFFQDPRPGASTVACPVTELEPWTLRQVSYRPCAGGMLVFPGWLYHGVEPNLVDVPRVSISFNYRLRWVSAA
jgi:uncharacterized protein (TIGR02466 family)